MNTSIDPPIDPPEEVLAARLKSDLLVDAQSVAAAIDRVSIRLTSALAEVNPLLTCVLHGGLMFTGMLMQRLHFPAELSYVHVGRYRDDTRGGELVWHAGPTVDCSNRHVVLVDDILDEGVTLAALVKWFSDHGAAAVSTAVLVDKRISAAKPIHADYVALSLEDRYLFGCGMDFKGYWRNLPAIYALEESKERKA